MFGAIALGGASLISGIMGGISQQRSAEDAVKYQNKLSRRQYAQTIQNYHHTVNTMRRDWDTTKEIWQAKRNQFSFQVKENNRAAAQAYYQNQVSLNKIEDRAKGDALDSFINLMEQNAYSKASSQSGRRSGMRQRANLMTQGIEMRRRADSLAYAEASLNERNDDIFRRTRQANMNSWYNVSIKPKAPIVPPMPLAPVMQSAPSRMPMYASFLNAGVNAVSTVGQLTPGGLFG